MTAASPHPRLRVVVADDERPARSYLLSLLRRVGHVEVVGEAATGTEAVRVIESVRPDLALLDLQMPELDGLGVVRALPKAAVPLVAFVTAYDAYAVQAFEVCAIDYLLKPVSEARLRETIARAQERLDQQDLAEQAVERVRETAQALAAPPSGLIERIPVRRREHVVLVPVAQLASVVAEGELLHLTTYRNERYTITYRLKDLEQRLDPAKFVRLGRGVLANVEAIQRVHLMPGGTQMIRLTNGQELPVSRIQARLIREQLLKL